MLLRKMQPQRKQCATGLPSGWLSALSLHVGSSEIRESQSISSLAFLSRTTYTKMSSVPVSRRTVEVGTAISRAAGAMRAVQDPGIMLCKPARKRHWLSHLDVPLRINELTDEVRPGALHWVF
jgi:hypothetical protein